MTLYENRVLIRIFYVSERERIAGTLRNLSNEELSTIKTILLG
jgi:hypothetical protein